MFGRTGRLVSLKSFDLARGGKDNMKIGDLEFDDKLVMDNMMGPNSLRIIEEMTRNLDLKEDMRVLDLGCGKGLTSIYLARKFGVTVYATDLWISASENFNRLKDLGLQDRIIPIHSDVHDLPFAEEYFDAIICIDAYHYFGHEEGFLDKHLAPLLKKGGRILVGVPGLQKEFDDGVPEEMTPYYQLDYNFHTCHWWRSRWEASDLVTEIHCRELDCHEKAWKEWLSADNEHAKQDIVMMETEGGKYFSTVFFSAIRKQE
jgi:cyclopropane fatty-acyl-phospholipid synthase-like methyltransferase